ncbi:MAG: hypothetical protein AB1391_02440 [Candidatus Micrarchaeota archaeon]
MPRGKRIIIDRKIDDSYINTFKTMDVEKIKDKYEDRQSSISSSLANVYNEAQKLYRDKQVEDDVLEKKGLYTIQSAYELLRQNGFEISFRAFGGRIERGTIASIKVRRKRYISIDTLNTMMNIRDEFYSVKDAYEIYHKANPKINYRAFIGRIEKKSVPSIKLGTKRLIPHSAIDVLVHIAKSYYNVYQSLQQLHKAGIGIKRNAFERRLDRKRIPFIKIAGRRYLPTDVVDELIEKEHALRK